MSYTLNWRGAIVMEHVQDAQLAAANELGDELVTMAQTLVNVDTGHLQSRIRHMPPHSDGGSVSMEWGVFDVHYAIYQELNWKPYLRPSADALYPTFVSKIRAHL